MPDVFTKQKRSEVMSHIRGRGNRDTELALVQLLRMHKITGWRRHEHLLGKPDFTFRKERVIVFVDGCFWHQCPHHCNLPVNNRQFWQRKLNANKARDKTINHALRQKGWTVLRIWEHDVAKRPDVCVRRIERALIARAVHALIQRA
jgi:DNA mismatch endonuclease, patch repair protein